jgi:hypothetical protein
MPIICEIIFRSNLLPVLDRLKFTTIVFHLLTSNLQYFTLRPTKMLSRNGININFCMPLQTNIKSRSKLRKGIAIIRQQQTGKTYTYDTITILLLT